MRDFFRQPHHETDMCAKYRMTQRHRARLRWIFIPPFEIARIEFPGLADVMHKCASQNNVPVDRYLGKGIFKFVDKVHSNVSNPTRVIDLAAALEGVRSWISLSWNVADALKSRLAKRVGPRLDCLRSQCGIADLFDFRQIFDDRSPDFVRNWSLQLSGFIIHRCSPRNSTDAIEASLGILIEKRSPTH